MPMSLSQTVVPLTVMAQLLFKTTVAELSVFICQYNFSAEELAAIGVTSETVAELKSILDRLEEMVNKTPEVAPTPTPEENKTIPSSPTN